MNIISSQRQHNPLMKFFIKFLVSLLNAAAYLCHTFPSYFFTPFLHFHTINLPYLSFFYFCFRFCQKLLSSSILQKKLDNICDDICSISEPQYMENLIYFIVFIYFFESEGGKQDIFVCIWIHHDIFLSQHHLKRGHILKKFRNLS